MPLRGRVEAFPLDAILHLLAATERTGVLEVRDEDEDGSIVVRRGRPVSAIHGDDRGTAALGPIFAAQEGDFEFRELDEVFESDLDGDLERILVVADEQRGRVRAIRSVIPNERVIPQLSARAADRGEIRLAPDQWRVLLAVDGQRDVVAVADQLGVTRLAAASHLADLAGAGLVDVVEPPAAPPSSDAPTARSYARLLPPMRPLASTVSGERVELWGTLPEFPLETIVQLLAGTRKTGRLEVRGGYEGCVLGVDSGSLVSAVVGDEAGELALGAAFTFMSGEFSYVPMAVAPAADLEGDLDMLLDRAVAARDRIAENRALIPSERMRFRLSERAAQVGPQITLTPEQWRALLAVNGERDVTLIAQQLRMRRLPTLVLLADLVRGGLIDVVPPPEPGKEAPPDDHELSWPYVERRRVPWTPAAPAPTEERGPAAEEEVALEGRAGDESPVVDEAPPATEAPAFDQTAAEEMPRAELEEPLEETPIDRMATEAVADDRLSALSGLFGPAEAAAADATAQALAAAPPPEAEPDVEAPLPPAAEPEVDPRLAAFGAPPAETAAPEAEPPMQWQTWDTPTAPADQLAAAEEAAPTEEAEVDPRFAALAMPPAEAEAPAEPEAASEPVWPEATHLRAEPVVGQPLPEMPPAPGAPPAAALAEKKKGGLFGGLFGGKAAPAVPSAGSLASTDAGRLAIFANELIDAYNGGQYGKARVEDRMIGLLMRVDEQAEPIDRPIPVTNEHIDVASIDDGVVPEAQAVPYLAALVRQVFDDAERVLGKDKARRGFRDVRDRVFGKHAGVLSVPAVAGRMPKV